MIMRRQPYVLGKVTNLSQPQLNLDLDGLLQGFLPLIPRVSLLSAGRNKYILSRKLNIAMKGVPSQEFRDLDYMV